MTRTPLSREKVKRQVHQAALLTAVLTRQVAAAVGVRTCWLWETAAMLPSARQRKVLRRPRGGQGRGHTAAAARLQLVEEVNKQGVILKTTNPVRANVTVVTSLSNSTNCPKRVI